EFLRTRVVEVAVHGLDLADALDRSPWTTPGTSPTSEPSPTGSPSPPGEPSPSATSVPSPTTAAPPA
ncbi:hypothetical protein ABZ541_31210, partial [Micromonospora sediminicola]